MNHFTLPSSLAGGTTAPISHLHSEQSGEASRNDWRLMGAGLLLLTLISMLLYAAPRLSANDVDAFAWPPIPAVTTDTSYPFTLSDAGNVFTLTILHTNDTWGYLDPCG